MPNTPAPRRPSKAAKPSAAAQDTALELARLRFQLWTRVVDGGRIAAWIIAAWVPLTAVVKIAHYIAGKNTQFTATVSVTIAISICISAGWAVTAVRSHERKREVDRLRGRNDDLERRILASTRQPEPPTVGATREPTPEEVSE